MVASTFGAAFDKLDRETQRKYARNMTMRKNRYIKATGFFTYDANVEYVILGDTPGPGRPNDPGYHHTPFYSTKNCSLWLNKQLIDAGIDESKLIWFNTTLADGGELSVRHLKILSKFSPTVIALGGNAEKWCIKHDIKHVKVWHPQAWKRFNSSEPYPLIEVLKSAKVMDREDLKNISTNLGYSRVGLGNV